MSALSTTTSRSVSANTMLGFLPPSSTATFFTVAAAARRIAWPVASPPVKLTRSTSSCSTSAAPTAPGPRTRLTAPAGTPASSSSATSQTVVSGVTSLGLTTTVQPAASAGASFHEICSSG